MAITIKLRHLFIQVIIVIFLLMAVELISMFALRSENLDYRPFITKVDATSNTRPAFDFTGFDVVNPLLGWSTSPVKFEELGYQVESNCIKLAGNGSDSSTLNVLITGGSTSDIYLDGRNWPVHLHKMLNDKGYNSTVYVAATGGYNSGQELLRLIEFSDSIAIDLHISYSGANEYDSDYISEYEFDLYDQLISKPSRFLPYTIAMITGAGRSGQVHLPFDDYTYRWKPADFWMRNVSMMRQISMGRDSEFIGLVQPVLNYTGKENEEGYDSLSEYYNWNLTHYDHYYPELIAMCSTKDYLFDLTHVFDDVEGLPYKDDCHLKEKYQEVVAARIAELVLAKLGHPQ